MYCVLFYLFNLKVDNDGILFYESHLKNEDRRLGERIVSFYYSQTMWNETDYEDLMLKLKAHILKAKLQPTKWSSDAKTLLADSFVVLRSDFSIHNINGYKVSRVTTHHLRAIIQIAECLSRLCPISSYEPVSIVNCAFVKEQSCNEDLRRFVGGLCTGSIKSIIGWEPISIIHYTRPGFNIKQPPSN